MTQRHRALEGTPPEFELKIEKLVYGGDGLGRHKGKVVFVPFTAPGDAVLVRPTETKSSFLRAQVLKMLQAGPGRGSPFCRYYMRCGGCQWQHMEYTRQIEAKRTILEELFHHHFPDTGDLQITVKACPKPAGYRARARVQVRGSAERPTVGFYRHRSHRVQDIVSCPLFLPALNDALAGARSAFVEGHLDIRTTELELACSDDGTTAFAAVEPGKLADGPRAGELLTRKVGDLLYASSPAAFFRLTTSCFMIWLPRCSA